LNVALGACLRQPFDERTANIDTRGSHSFPQLIASIGPSSSGGRPGSARIHRREALRECHELGTGIDRLG
jgi:hypothetical protein